MAQTTLCSGAGARGALAKLLRSELIFAPQCPTEQKPGIKKILVISLAGIGDTLFATPLIHELRANFPSARIDALVMWPGSKDLLERNPHVDHVYQKNLIQAGLAESLKFLWQLRKEGYDLSINTHPQSRIHYRAVARLISARIRVSHGYDDGGVLDRLLVTRDLKQDYGKHAVENNLALLEAAGATRLLPRHDYEVFLSPADRDWAADFIARLNWPGRKLLGVHVGSGGTKNLALRRWPLERYLELFDQLRLSRPELGVLLFGGPDEEKDLQTLQERTSRGQVAVVRTRNLRQAAALVKHCDLFLSVDTALMHLAAAMKVPNLAVIETPTWNKPIEPHNHPFVLIPNPAVAGKNLDFYRYDGRGIRGTPEELGRCMRAVTVESVIQVLGAMLRGDEPETVAIPEAAIFRFGNLTHRRQCDVLGAPYQRSGQRTRQEGSDRTRKCGCRGGSPSRRPTPPGRESPELPARFIPLYPLERTAHSRRAPVCPPSSDFGTPGMGTGRIVGGPFAMESWWAGGGIIGLPAFRGRRASIASAVLCRWAPRHASTRLNVSWQKRRAAIGRNGCRSKLWEPLVKTDPVSLGTIQTHRSVLFALALALLGFNLSLVQRAQAAAFSNAASMNIPRHLHTMTLLPNGKLLVAGGLSGPTATNSAEIYDPATGKWTLTGSLTTARTNNTATLLPNGKVLVAGASANGHYSELFDPASGLFFTNAFGPMMAARVGHTATLLPDGRVLVTGGDSPGSGPSSAELYVPATGLWTNAGSLTDARQFHAATLLPNGKVLLTGGLSHGAATNSAEVYDPATGTWLRTNALNVARYSHSAVLLPDGKVLVAGGTTINNAIVSSAELYNPATGTWTVISSMPNSHSMHTATLLPNGKMLLVGGSGSLNAELFDPIAGGWIDSTLVFNASGTAHTAALLPNGRLLLAGGFFVTTNSATTVLYNFAVGAWARGTNGLSISRRAPTATLLPNGKVLVAGGQGTNNLSLSSVDLFDPAIGTNGTWTATSALFDARASHTATLLPSGKVLVTGGLGANSTSLASTELYDPVSGTWTITGTMAAGRINHTATFLPNGRVLVAGGLGGVFSLLSSAEIYDPATGNWINTGSLNGTRVSHTATLLPNGKVLVAGGFDNSLSSVASTELYDLATGLWFTNTAMNTARSSHTATLLPNGKVLVAGGVGTPGNGSTELYDPFTGTWTFTGPLATNRLAHTARLLSNGQVLVTGGTSGSIALTDAELYDPATGVWTTTAALGASRSQHRTTLLPNGRLLVTGGQASGVPASAELYDVGLGFGANWQPQIIKITSPLGLGTSLVSTGFQFRGISEGSGGGGTLNSSGDFPLVQLRSLDSERTIFLSATNWSATNFSSTPVSGFPPGHALATVFVNGIPSTGSVVNVSVPVPAPSLLTDAKQLADGSFQFAFTNSVGALFAALATTNLTLPLSNWTLLSGVPEILPGRFQFTDRQATNNPRRLYRVRSP